MATIMAEVFDAQEQPSDRRAENAMEPANKAAHYRLQEWGRWLHERWPGGLPAQTVLARIIECGVDGALARGFISVDMPKHIQNVQDAIDELVEMDQRAIKVFYLHWEPKEVRARRARMGEQEFERVLARARGRVAVAIRALDRK